MISHASPAMERFSKPLPPLQAPPVPKESTNTTATSTSLAGTPSPRIRRKPLPSTAFSTRSVLSSPISTYSDKDDSSRSAAQQSGLVLNEILVSPSRTPNPARRIPSPELPPVPQPSLATTTKTIPEKISIADFPLPPQHELRTKHRTDDAIRVSLTSEEVMAGKDGERPPPLRMEPVKAVKALDAKKAQSPGSVFTSFFSRKQIASPQNVSPGGESSITEISDTRSPSPHIGSTEDSSYFAQPQSSTSPLQRQSSWQSSHSSVSNAVPRRMNSGASGSIGLPSTDLSTRCNMLESELKDISRELAGSIRRELDLEDLVEKLQAEAPLTHMSVDRTSDYFSDSGTSSGRQVGSEFNSKEEIDKVKREADQQRAQLRIDLSQKWQSEVSQRKTLESHVQILENKLAQTRQTSNDMSDTSARIRELELSLDDARRRLAEERQTKENFEDLLTALRVELEQHRNERDNLRDETVPNLRAQIEGLESTFGDAQKQAYEFARMQQEIQSLRDENAAISSARKMEQEMMRSGMHFGAEDTRVMSPRSSRALPKSANPDRMSTSSNRGQLAGLGLSTSVSISRSNSVLNRGIPDTPDSLADRLGAVEQQRDALHSAVKYLRKRYDHQNKTHEKKISSLHAQIEKLGSGPSDSRRGGYEKEVRTLRQEINLLRKRADDALDQKWQCEKGLVGLKMDLDRSKQETASLQKLLQARSSDDPELLSHALESAMNDLQQTQARRNEAVISLEHEQRIAEQLAECAKRSEGLAMQVRQQLEANSSLRARLISAVENGEHNQQASATQINELQSKLKRLEDTITSTQLQSETAVTKHEEEIRVLKSSHNMQLMRARAGLKSPTNGSAQPPPMSPMFANKSPRLDNTSSGPGMALNQALKTEVLETKVAELEKALRDAENEMEEVVGRMNKAQIEVFELQQEKDEEHKRTRKLELEIRAERERFQALLSDNNTK